MVGVWGQSLAAGRIASRSETKKEKGVKKEERAACGTLLLVGVIIKMENYFDAKTSLY